MAFDVEINQYNRLLTVYKFSFYCCSHIWKSLYENSWLKTCMNFEVAVVKLEEVLIMI